MHELPEFARSALEALREPLESGHITISRAARQARFPARFQLVAAMNPCPCGWLGAQAVTGRACRCAPDTVARYQARISGPLLDRIDMQVEVPAARPDELLNGPVGESTAAVVARVRPVQTLQQTRQGGPNAGLAGEALEANAPLAPAARQFLQNAAQQLGWSGRSIHRVLKVARTIADLAAQDVIDVVHVAEAMQYRRVIQGA